MQRQSNSEYFYLHLGENKDKYGLRYAIPDDAIRITKLYLEEYGYNYVNPIVYNLNTLKENISKRENVWIIGENLSNNEIIATSLIELRDNYAFSSKTVINNKYRGQGLGSKFGFMSVKQLNKDNLLTNRIKIDSDVRAVQITAQRLSEAAGGLPYGFIPFYNNFGDKRGLNWDYYHPYPTQEEESAFLYFVPLPRLIKNRVREVFLLDNDLVSFYYNYISKIKLVTKVMMKKDLVHNIPNDNIPDYVENKELSISIDSYGSKVYLLGVNDINIIDFLLNKFKNYRMLIWNIPTTIEGTKSMNDALEKGFIVCGYNVGGFKLRYSEDLIDSVIFVKFQNPIHKNNFKEIKFTSKNKALYFHVINQL